MASVSHRHALNGFVIAALLIFAPIGCNRPDSKAPSETDTAPQERSAKIVPREGESNDDIPPTAPVVWIGRDAEGWTPLKWGMREAEVIEKCPHTITKLDAPIEYYQAYCPAVIKGITFGEASLEARFQFGEKSGVLRQILLRHPANAVGAGEAAAVSSQIQRAYEQVFNHLVSLYGEPAAELENRREADSLSNDSAENVRVTFRWEVKGTSIDLSLRSNETMSHLTVAYFPSDAEWRSKNRK